MKMIIIRSTDEITWERYGDYEYPFVGFYDYEAERRAIKDVMEMENVENYYIDFVELGYCNKFKKPFQ